MIALIQLMLCLLASFATVESRASGGARRARLSLAGPMPSYYYTNIDGHPGTYAFGYDVADIASGNTQFRTEQRYPNGTVVGSYGYVDARGAPAHYTYIADAKGYRVKKVNIRAPPRAQDVVRPHSPPSPPSDYLSYSSPDEQPEFLIASHHPRLPNPARPDAGAARPTTSPPPPSRRYPTDDMAEFYRPASNTLDFGDFESY